MYEVGLADRIESGLARKVGEEGTSSESPWEGEGGGGKKADWATTSREWGMRM